MCGIIGIVANQPVNQMLYDGLLVLQHRGQDAAGIATCDDGRFYMHKNNGCLNTERIMAWCEMFSILGI